MFTNEGGYILAFNERIIGTEEGVVICDQLELDGLDVAAIYPLNLVENGNYKLAILTSEKLPRDLQTEDLVGLRRMLGLIGNEDQYVMLSSAAQIATWHASFKFCPRCATTLDTHVAEFAKVCPGCGHHQYPRISPCIIVLVRKDDRCLLAHAAKFSSGRYSTLAGFIEAGESAESAVIREVQEEVGITVKNVEYCFSQSWPFPHSFMLGFFAEYASGHIRPDGIEILDADWFSVDDLPDLPPKFTIARRLIDKFLLAQGCNVDEKSALFIPTK